MQRCIDAACGGTYGLRERIYVCPRCGGTLEIDCRLAGLRPAGRAAALRKLWASRAASHDPRDVSGVWRYREMLPFDEPIPFVTLFEGNTPLYHGPRSARYCGLDDLRLKHQGCNPTGSFKDTGMTRRGHASRRARREHRRLREHGKHCGQPRRLRGTRRIAGRHAAAARADQRRETGADRWTTARWSAKSTAISTIACA